MNSVALFAFSDIVRDPPGPLDGAVYVLVFGLPMFLVATYLYFEWKHWSEARSGRQTPAARELEWNPDDKGR